MAAGSNKALEEWVHRIRDEEMPIFGHTVQSIVTVAEDDEAPAAELARVVLQDASMTTRVLKLANTIYYNPRGQSISTVSRAVVVLGFQTVHNMCLSIALVDSFVQGRARDRLIQQLARSIHAAVQARTLAIAADDRSPEEVFIATLLFHLGELAFWCFSGDVGEELDAVMSQPGYTPEAAQDEVLGFRLRQLTASLAHEWRITGLLSEFIADPKSAGARGQVIRRSHELATAAELHGWRAPETVQVIQQIAKTIGRSNEETRQLVHHNAREAARIAAVYGASAAARAIPVPAGRPGAEEGEEDAATTPAYPEPDGMLQLKILRELSMLLEKSSDFNLILELVLEGIYRGVGMDRTLFALSSPDRRSVRAKYGLGDPQRQLTSRFYFSRGERTNVFFDVLEQQRCIWVDTAQRPELQNLVGGGVTSVVGKRPFYVCPIVVNGRSIGLFYADRGLSGRSLDEESYESFKHFAKQAGMGLSMLASRRR